MSGETETKPRYCYLQRSNKGYGFNLHGEAPDKPGSESSSGKRAFYHLIKSVDSDSPAESGGLQQDDRLIGVNGKYVDQRPHNEVVQIIKSGGAATWLLVVDKATDDYYYRQLQRKPKFSDAVYGQIDKRGESVDINSIPMEEELLSEVDNVFPADDYDNDNDRSAEAIEVTTEETQEQTEQQIYVPPPPSEPAERENEDEVDQNERVEDVPQVTTEVTNKVIISNNEVEHSVRTVNTDSGPMFSDMQAARAAAKGQKHGAKQNGGNWSNKWQDFNRL